MAVAASRNFRAESEERDDRLYGASSHHGVHFVVWRMSSHELYSAARAPCGAVTAAGRTILGQLGNLVRAAAQNDAEVSEGGVRRSDLLSSLQQRVHPPRSLRARQTRRTGSERAGAGGRGRAGAGRAGRGVQAWEEVCSNSTAAPTSADCSRHLLRAVRSCWSVAGRAPQPVGTRAALPARAPRTQARPYACALCRPACPPDSSPSQQLRRQRLLPAPNAQALGEVGAATRFF